eukprot:COSAG05_NODE_1024_length_6123_cov_7.197709_5_plen_156_part_00
MAERHQLGRSRHPHLGLGLHGGVAHELRDLLLQVVRAQVAEGDPAAAVVLGHELALLVRVVQRLPQRAQPDARLKLAAEQVIQEVRLGLGQPALPLIDRGGGVEPPAAAVVLRRLLPGDPAIFAAILRGVNGGLNATPVPTGAPRPTVSTRAACL